MAYSIDYRKAAIGYKESGHTIAELREVFKLGSQTYNNWKKLETETGELQFRNAKTRKRKIDPEELKRAIEEKPDNYLRELAEKFGCSTTAVHNYLEKLQITYKKRHSHIRRNPKS